MTRRRALLIGNDQYPHDPYLTCLKKTENDVRGLATVLSDPSIGRFEFGEDEILINRSKYEMEIALENFFGRSRSDDLLLFYFAGHGLVDVQGRLYLCAANTVRQNLMSTAVSAHFINDLMNESMSRSQIIIIDCCYSGAFVQGVRAAPGGGVNTRTIFADNSPQRARVVITATDTTQFAWEDNEITGDLDTSNNSLFTRYLISGLQTGKADTDGDGVITHDELFHYVHDCVVEKNPHQTPKMWVYDYRGRLNVAFNSSKNSEQPLKTPPEIYINPIKPERVIETDPFKPERVIEPPSPFLNPVPVELERTIDQVLEDIRNFLSQFPGKRSTLQQIEKELTDCSFEGKVLTARDYLNRLINDNLLEEVPRPGVFQLSQAARARLMSKR